MHSSGAVAQAASRVIVRDFAQLRALQVNPKVLGSSALIIDLPGIPPETACAAAARIVSHVRECGCGLGATSMALSFIAAFLGFALRYGIFSPSFYWRLPASVMCAFAGAAVGKIYGLLRARRRFKREISKLFEIQNKFPTEV